MKKNITILTKKFGFRLMIIHLFLNSMIVTAQENPFIYFKDNVFQYQCDTFNPMAINYIFNIAKKVGNNEPFHVSPNPKYCNKDECSTMYTCGADINGWKNELIEHFIKIEDLEFNLIRVCGLVEIFYQEEIYTCDPYSYLTSSGCAEYDDDGCYVEIPGISLDTENDFIIMGDLLQELIDIMNESGTNLKLIVVMGSRSHEQLANHFSEYLSYIANRFKDEPRIFAYDLYNEPSWYVKKYEPVPDKILTAQWTSLWYNSIKSKAPSHFVTMGCEIDFSHWDAQLLPLDFISIHRYEKPVEEEAYDIGKAVIRFKTWFKWLSNTFTRPYIIGETGLSGMDELLTGDTLDPDVCTRQEQADFASYTLNYTKKYNSLGYSWWNYKDYYNLNPCLCEDCFLGIVYNEEFTGTDLETSKPEIGGFFLNYNPDSTGCYDAFNNNGPCTDPVDSAYYAPNPDSFNIIRFTGNIRDENNNPIKDAHVMMNFHYEKEWPVSKAITDINGDFTIKFKYLNWSIGSIIITFPGMTSIEEDIPDNIINGSGEYQLENINPNLLPLMPNYDYYTLSPNTEETWDSQRYLPYKEIRIKPGAQLNLTADLFLKENAKIVVERGGKLFINGGRITCSCGLWKGIEVWGNSYQANNPAYQGWVKVTNGGIIENSLMGIYTNKSDEGVYDWIPGYTGGIVQASDAHFINNKVAVQFFPYSFNSASLFEDCFFKTTDEYIGTTNPEYFVNVSGMVQLRITSCDFLNQTSVPHSQGGVYSYNSYILFEGDCIEGYPCTSWDKGFFQNLYYGIYAIATNPNRYVDIRHTIFDNNYRGVYISGMTGAWVTSNTFNINENSQYKGNYGLYLNNSTGYWVEDNDFYHEGSTPFGFGIIVNNSGGDNNEIYRNRFDNLTQGISAQRKNCDINQEPETGLQILCNDFDLCTADILIPQPGPSNGIAPYQGFDSSDPEDMAGNLFYIESETPDNDYDDINNQGVHVTYYYPINNNDYDVMPVDYTHEPPYNTVTLEEKIVNPPPPDEDWTPENGCPSHIETGGGGGIGSGELKEQMAESQQKIDSTQSLLVMLIDGGNTEAMQEDVEYSFPPEAMAIYTELIDKSPYLSDTVVSTAIEKENVLPGAMIRDVMVANPHTAKNDELMNKLDERWTPLPEYMKEQILQGKNIVSVMEKTESKLAGFMLNKSRAMNELARNFRNDSVAGVDSLAALYGTDNSVQSKYRLAFLSMEQGAWSLGISTLNSIPSQFELSAEQQAEHENLVEYYTLLASLGDSLPDSTGVQQLTGIMESEKGAASMYALNMLIDLGEVQYDEPIDMPDFMKSATATGSFTSLNSDNFNEHRLLKVIPNPASDYVIIEYNLDDELQGATIEITDIGGKPVQTIQAVNTRDQVTLDTRNWKRSVYVAVLKINGKIKETVKFTITD